MDTTTTTQIATMQISPIAAPVALPVRVSTPALACSPWERSHASTSVTTKGGVRLLPATAGRLRDDVLGNALGDTGAYGASSFPSAGPSTSSPPV
jgi:hypothetical protein